MGNGFLKRNVKQLFVDKLINKPWCKPGSCLGGQRFSKNEVRTKLTICYLVWVWVGENVPQFSYSWLSLLIRHTVKLDNCCPDYCQLQPGQPCLLYSWLSLPWSYTVNLDYSCLDHCLRLTVYRQLVLLYVRQPPRAGLKQTPGVLQAMLGIDVFC